MFQPIQRYQIAVKAVQELGDPLVQIWEEIPKDTIRHLIRLACHIIFLSDFQGAFKFSPL